MNLEKLSQTFKNQSWQENLLAISGQFSDVVQVLV
jgi:hypothetical protein